MDECSIQAVLDGQVSGMVPLPPLGPGARSAAKGDVTGAIRWTELGVGAGREPR